MSNPERQTTPLVAVIGPAVLVLIWAALAALRLFPESLFPSPLAVARGLAIELTSGRLVDDCIASLFRVSVGFLLSVVLGVPTGLVLGHSILARQAFLPLVNFFRSLSPLAWIPFAILWFGIGDVPAIFLIFMASVFPITLATAAAVGGIPSVYFRVAEDYGMRGLDAPSTICIRRLARLSPGITALPCSPPARWCARCRSRARPRAPPA